VPVTLAECVPKTRGVLLLEQVRVDVEGDGRARVPELPRHPHRIKPEADDEDAGEGVAEVVRADPAAEARALDSALDAATHGAMVTAATVRAAKHVLRVAAEP
jgi:hypothetical protein